MKRIWDTDESAAVWSLKHDELNLLKTKPARNHPVQCTFIIFVV
jgi:hypothetical protein